jgi:hypothetical protein
MLKNVKKCKKNNDTRALGSDATQLISCNVQETLVKTLLGKDEPEPDHHH